MIHHKYDSSVADSQVVAMNGEVDDTMMTYVVENCLFEIKIDVVERY